jgi:hypothetical protein
VARPTSFRLSEELLDRLDREAAAAETSTAALVSSMLAEGIATRRFSGVVYRDGPTGRRAALVGGPDVWEVVRDVRTAKGRGEKRLAAVASNSGLTLPQVRLAVDFYTSNPDEIDRRIELDEQEAQRVQALIERREQLLSS